MPSFKCHHCHKHGIFCKHVYGQYLCHSCEEHYKRLKIHELNLAAEQKKINAERQEAFRKITNEERKAANAEYQRYCQRENRESNRGAVPWGVLYESQNTINRDRIVGILIKQRYEREILGGLQSPEKDRQDLLRLLDEVNDLDRMLGLERYNRARIAAGLSLFDPSRDPLPTSSRCVMNWMALIDILGKYRFSTYPVRQIEEDRKVLLRLVSENIFVYDMLTANGGREYVDILNAILQQKYHQLSSMRNQSFGSLGFPVSPSPEAAADQLIAWVAANPIPSPAAQPIASAAVQTITSRMSRPSNAQLPRGCIKLFGNVSDECAICCEPMQSTETTGPATTPCGHIFHDRCLINLMASGDRRCPDCRSALQAF